MIDFTKLTADADSLRAQFLQGQPFPLVVIDNFLTVDGLNAIRSVQLTSSPSSKKRSSDYIFARNKFENPDLKSISPATAKLRADLLGDQFQGLLCEICGESVFIDPAFTGGGLHQGGKGSFLDMHVDFTHHPSNRNWARKLNLLLYLNPNWEPSYGGCLDLRNGQTNESGSIEPIENRMVIMSSNEHTVHGYKAINFPTGMLRTSIAAYAYSSRDKSKGVVKYKSTVWYPENTARSLLAPLLSKLTPLKQRFLGSRTANRTR